MDAHSESRNEKMKSIWADAIRVQLRLRLLSPRYCSIFIFIPDNLLDIISILHAANDNFRCTTLNLISELTTSTVKCYAGDLETAM